MKQAEVHLELAIKARSYLKAQVKFSKNILKTEFLDKGLPIPSIGATISPGSKSFTMHYSFDFAQQV